MSASSQAYELGQTVQLKDDRIALIRFIGPTKFQTGEWVGVELEEEGGKNDGSVKGVRYFDCRPGYGLFLRPDGIAQVLGALDNTSAGRNTAAKKTVQSSVTTDRKPAVSRQSVVASRRTSTIPAVGGANGTNRGTVEPRRVAAHNDVVPKNATSRAGTPPARPRAAATNITAGQRQSILGTATDANRRGLSRPSIAGGTPKQPNRTSILGTPISRDPRIPNAPVNSQRAPLSSRSAVPSRTTKPQTSAVGSEEPNGRLHERLQPPSTPPSEADAPVSVIESDSAAEDDLKEEGDDTITNFAPPSVSAGEAEPTAAVRARRPSSPGAVSLLSQRQVRSTAASNRHVEQLEAKIRLLERKRLEDRELKQSLEKALQERDHARGIIEKLQNKYRPQQQELTELKQSLVEAEKKYADLEAEHAEHDSVLEMATLDREVAEETAEALKAELEALKSYNEEIRLELDIVKEENDELTREMSPEERESAGWTQMQLSNDRLRNALLALRDRASDEKEELTERIRGLEEQIKDFDAIKAHYEDTREKLLRSEADTNDLRQQLEVAQQADEIIETMTETNERLEATVADLKATVADLEDLRELNDELEINHVEAEKILQEELDFKDALLQDRERAAKRQQEVLDDANLMISQFRQLVQQLQADLADMSASKQISESEAKELEDKSRAMVSLNMKLHATAAKTQVKTIDLELRKLEAQQASDHLAIVQHYLPETFQSGKDSVLTLLRFKRIHFKANLVHAFLKERVASFVPSEQDRDIFAACHTLDKVIWISGMAQRFVDSMSTCSVADFAKYESALYELEPVERALNGCVDAFRREDSRMSEMAEELQRSIAVMSHLMALHIANDAAGQANDLVMRASCLQSQLESSTAALQVLRLLIEENVHTAPHGDDGLDDEEARASELNVILSRAETIANQARSAKVTATRAHRSLIDLQSRCLTLDPQYKEALEGSESVAREVSAFILKAGDAVQALLDTEDHPEPFSPNEIAVALCTAAGISFALQSPEVGPFNVLATKVKELAGELADFAALASDLDNTIEYETQRPPWIARADELRSASVSNVNVEEELERAHEKLRERDSILQTKEAELEEQSVRVEMLEARMKDASRRSAKIAELEKEVHRARDEEARYQRLVENLKAEKDREIEQIRTELGRRAEDMSRGRLELDSGAMGSTTRLAMKRLHHKIASLESALRILKAESDSLRLPSQTSSLATQQHIAWLHEQLQPPQSARQVKLENLRKEGADMLQNLLQMAAGPPIVDLTTIPQENRLAWRPLKQNSRWKVEAGLERYLKLNDMGSHIVRRAKAS